MNKSKQNTGLKFLSVGILTVYLITGPLIPISELFAAVGDPSANFQLSSSSVDEAIGTTQIRVEFGAVVNTSLNYTITGVTATDTVDYVAILGPVLVSGQFVDIPVDIINDELMSEEVEFIVIKLDTGMGYQRGSRSEHTLSIIENDVVWTGVLETLGVKTDISLEIVNSVIGLSGQLTSDNVGSYPLGSWPAIISMSPTLFTADIDPIPALPQATSFNMPFTRNISLYADSTLVTPTTAVVSDDIIFGSFTESLVPVDVRANYLARELTGTFTLVRALPRVTSYNTPLEPIL